MATVNQLSQNVQELQKDMAQVGVLVERIDITIEKLTEVSSTVSQLLAVQGTRLEMQEKLQDRLQTLVEQRKIETDKAINKIYSQISQSEEKLRTDLNENYEEILDEIKSLSGDSKVQHSALNDRISTMEKWMYGIVGGTSVIVFLATLITYIL